MTSRQLLILAARAELQGPFVGNKDILAAQGLAAEARARAEVRELFERLEES